MTKTEDRTSKAIFVNLSDDEGSKLYVKLSVLRAGLDITWKELMLSSLASTVGTYDPKLADQITKYLDKKVA
jgi:hypothetical protein